MYVWAKKRRSLGTLLFFFPSSRIGTGSDPDRIAKDSVHFVFFSSFVEQKTRRGRALSRLLPHHRRALMAPLHHDGGDPQAAPNAYEQEREARIAANRARLVELGIVSTTNASATSAAMPLGVLSYSSGRPSAWARSMFGACQKATRRRPTVALKVRVFLLQQKGMRKRSARRNSFMSSISKGEKKTQPPSTKKKKNATSPFADLSPREAPAGSVGSRPRERASARACRTPSTWSATPTSGGGGPPTSTTAARGRDPPPLPSLLPPPPPPPPSRRPTPPPSPSAPSTSPSSPSAASTEGPGATGTGAAPAASSTTPIPWASAPSSRARWGPGPGSAGSRRGRRGRSSWSPRGA